MQSDDATIAQAQGAEKNTKWQEILAFVVLAVLIWPILTVGVVGGYGFLIWMSQLVLGPPGPPH
ncbi:nitrate reductase [Microvirga sp. c23x22]|uniref:Nitrate reductase n=2 Tax=Microvirga terricola TaxID=2719797 RepID=A0ABX0V864_9HYPH|nr:periplasmic nitrate reductase, NapE protein [Microvirga terricola]NIX75928.1 nitrate reductase [Microvirga terricola]